MLIAIDNALACDAEEAAENEAIDEGVASEYLTLLEGVEDPQSVSEGSQWLQYLMRERDSYILPPPGTNLNYLTNTNTARL